MPSSYMAMASSSSSLSSLHFLLPPNSSSSCVSHRKRCYMSFQTTSQFVPSKSKPLTLQQLNKRESILFSSDNNLQGRRRNFRKPRSATIVAAQSNFLKVLQTVWRVGKDGIDAGTNLVPDSVPRPIARISVAGAAVAISLFVLKSFLSTVSFVLAMMGLIYFVFIALNKNEGPRGDDGSSTTTDEDPLEEARRIMDKYK